MSLRDDVRGQSFAYLTAGMSIVLGAGLFVVLEEVIPPLLSFTSSTCVSTACDEGVTNLQNSWQLYPVVIAGLVFILIIAASIFQSRRPA